MPTVTVIYAIGAGITPNPIAYEIEFANKCEKMKGFAIPPTPQIKSKYSKIKLVAFSGILIFIQF